MSLRLSWEDRTLADGRWFRCRFGPLNLLTFNRGDEWQIASWSDDRYDDLPEEGGIDDLPDDLTWVRWTCEKNDRLIKFQPAFPELPLIARPRSAFTIAPSSSALFHVGVPASITILASTGGAMAPLATLPTQPLSKSWHGNRSSGNPCYSLRTRAKRNYSPSEWPEHDIVCAVDLKNRRPASFAFESLYLDTGHLSIFEQDGQLWSNASRVNIPEQEHEEADVTYAPSPLGPASEARELVAPRLGRTRGGKLFAAFSSFSDVLR